MDLWETKIRWLRIIIHKAFKLGVFSLALIILGPSRAKRELLKNFLDILAAKVIINMSKGVLISPGWGLVKDMIKVKYLRKACDILGPVYRMYNIQKKKEERVSTPK